MGTFLRRSFGDEDTRFGRAFGHWTFQLKENHFDDLSCAPASTRYISLRRSDKNWGQLEKLGSLEEITAFSPTREQRSVIFSLRRIKRLRLLDGVRVSLSELPKIERLEELALLNVSGPRDLSDVARLSNLRSLMVENMRSLEEHHHLGKLSGLQCLCLCNGFVEQRASITGFAFLAELSNLRHLYCDLVDMSGDASAIAAIAACDALETLKINPYGFSLDAHAFMHAARPDLRAQFPSLLCVQGDSERFAHRVADAEALTGADMMIDPRVKPTAGLPFTRFRRGPRDAILAQARAFEAYFQQAVENAEQHLAAINRFG